MDKKQTKTNLPPSANYKYVLLSESSHRGNFLEYIFLKKKKNLTSLCKLALGAIYIWLFWVLDTFPCQCMYL